MDVGITFGRASADTVWLAGTPYWNQETLWDNYHLSNSTMVEGEALNPNDESAQDMPDSAREALIDEEDAFANF